MKSYDIFALYYDSLTKNVNYTDMADYFLKLCERLNHHVGIVVDLACGTGSFTLELHKKGVDVYGIDSSEAMLSQAMEKAYDEDADILFLKQKMQNLNLYGTVNTVFCTLDSINHLPNFSEIQKAFDKVSFFMEKDGLFIFDFNTQHKHRNVLNNNCFVFETDEVYCVWQNEFEEETDKINISLDFFVKENNTYTRHTENFSEITTDTTTLIKMLEKSGFTDIEFFDNLSFTPPTDSSERIVVVAKKKENTNKEWTE